MTKAPPLALTASALVASLALAACQTTASAPAASPPLAVGEADPGPPPFVEAVCGDCHAVEPPFLSPNPAAPTFEAIANTRGVTRASLEKWLGDAHNYPDEMEFDLEENWVQLTADYIVTLRSEDFTPDP